MMLGTGQIRLANGTATVAHRRIPADAVVVVNRTTLLGVAGELMRPVVTDRVGFTITSLNPLDTSVIQWMVFV